MTIKAPVFQRDPVTLEQEKNLGTFEFEQLPAPGDRVNIPHSNGRVGRYRVICVAHEPLQEGTTRATDWHAAFVYVEFLEEFG